MRRKTVKAFAAALSASMILSLTPVSVFAEGLAAPTEVSLGIAGSVAGTQVLRFDFSENDKDWLKAVTGVSVDGTEYKKDSWINMMPSANTWYAEEGYDYDTYQSTYYLRVTNDKADTTEFLVTAEGYEDVIVSVVKNADGSYAAQMKDLHPSGDNTDPDETPAETTKKTITIDQVSLGSKSGRWILSFPEVTDYVSSIESLSVNGEEWAAQDYEVNLGGKYYQNTDDNEIRFVGTKWTVGGHDILKSGDVITITSSVYEDLTLKFNYDGTYAAITEDDGEGDLYQLNVKLEGTFGSAIKGQKEYDAVSSATGVVSSSDNSDVKVYAAISEKGSELSSDAWQELGVNSEIQIDPDKTFVSIVPDTEKGTSEDRVSGLEGLYLTIGNELTLIGAPQDPGDYLVTVTITDTQGRTAVSNAIPLKIHSGEETLAEMLTVENLTQTADGKYMWKNMEPWTITVFGSNVEGESETIVVPAGLKAWYGSSESGLYGNLGYAIPWADVQADRIPQTLIIPAGCDLTMVNMEFQSSVKIIVEDGGKLTLRDSVVQGIIDVKGGGSFSMNYNGFGEDAGFQTGSSVDGQIILEDGAVIENAAVVSHTNYIANGAVNDRTNADAVVAVKGNVTVKGQVFIAGDEAGSNPNVGQTGLLVQNGTLTLEEGAVLAVYGGDGKVVLTGDGGTAIELVNGTITGSGKLIAVGGAGQFGNGGAAVRGSGTIETDDIFLQGGSTRESNMLNGASGAPGAANPDGVAVKGSSRSVKNGILNDLISDDAQAALYWNTGVDAVPDIFVYTTEPVPAEDADDDTNKDADDQDDDSKKDEDDQDDDSRKDEDDQDDDSKKDEDDQDDDSKKDADDQDDDSHTSIIVVVHRAVKSVVRYAVRIFRGLFRF